MKRKIYMLEIKKEITNAWDEKKIQIIEMKRKIKMLEMKKKNTNAWDEKDKYKCRWTAPARGPCLPNTSSPLRKPKVKHMTGVKKVVNKKKSKKKK